MRMRRKKNLFQRLETASHLIIQNCFRQQWNFSKLYVEIGCGKGRFISEMAVNNPDVFFVGIEKVPNVAISAIETVDRLAIENVRFILGDAAMLEQYFRPGEVERLFINFPDPWLSKKQHYRRLTHRSFLHLYRKMLVPSGYLEFKTDNKPLYLFSIEEFQASGWRLEHVSENLPVRNIKTEYEERFRDIGLPIYGLTASPY